MKIRSVLMMALLAALTGTSFAGVTGSPYGVADSPSQAQPPVDCKKDPTDPRCKKGK
jgi:hypothetical protein